MFRWWAALAATVLPGALAGQSGYSGQWTIAPSAQYSCAFGAVQFTVNRIQITDNNPSVTIALMPTFGAGTLSGTFLTPTSVQATRNVPGSCTESYQLTIQFTSSTQFTGTFDASYAGLNGACLDCVHRTWQITGTRVPVASYATFGSGCAGSLGVTHLTALQLPRPGTTLVVALDHLPANAAVQVTGWSNTISNLGPLPVPLAGFGMPGCFGRVSLDATAFVVGTANAATWSLALPNLSSLLGASFHQQALVLDPGLNPLGAAISDAATAVVGT